MSAATTWQQWIICCQFVITTHEMQAPKWTLCKSESSSKSFLIKNKNIFEIKIPPTTREHRTLPPWKKFPLTLRRITDATSSRKPVSPTHSPARAHHQRCSPSHVSISQPSRCRRARETDGFDAPHVPRAGLGPGSTSGDRSLYRGPGASCVLRR